MKKGILFAFIFLRIAVIQAQNESITNILVNQRQDNSGIVDVYFDLIATDPVYNITFEVSFDGGNVYSPVLAEYLTGDIGEISPGNNKHTIWNGQASHPNIFTNQAKLKISATSLSSFICGASFIDSRDGNSYQTVQKGNQCWLANNLRYLPSVVGASMQSSTIPYQYVYGYQGTNTAVAKATSNYTNFGVLYNWPSAMNGAGSSYSNPSGIRGICPYGWHLPSDAEWTEFSNFLIANGYNYDGTTIGNKIGKSMSTTNGWNTSTVTGAVGYNQTTNNSSGFSAPPGGVKIHNIALFSSMGSSFYVWTTSLGASNGAYIRRLDWNSSQLIREWNVNFMAGHSVRCVKNVESQISLPYVITNPIIMITDTSAVSGGNIVNDGGATIIERGLVWNTESYPNLETHAGKITHVPGPGAFVSQISGLTPGLIYYVRAYATNSEGTSFGNEVLFTTSQSNFICGTSLLTDVDGNSYGTVEIGNQCWMNENLRTTHYQNGVPIEYPGTNTFAWQNNFIGAYAWYNNQVSWKSLYGALYNWHAVNNSNGLCPSGWRIPSQNAYSLLELYLCDSLGGNNCNNDFPFDSTTVGFRGSSGEGNALKSCRQPNSPVGGICNTTEEPLWTQNPTVFGTDHFGFAGLPGGERSDSGSFSGMHMYANFWTSTPYEENHAFNRLLTFYSPKIERNTMDKTKGISIRCLKNGPPFVQIKKISEVTQISAKATSIVLDNGGSEATEVGLVWSTSENPDLNNNSGMLSIPINGAGFSGLLTDLTFATTYYVRAYAINEYGTGYSKQVQFTTRSYPPIVITSPLSTIEFSLAIGGGQVVYDGGTDIISRGVIWSTNENPTVNLCNGMTIDSSGLGTFISHITGLIPEEDYFVRAYATNSTETGYGEQIHIITPELSNVLCASDSISLHFSNYQYGVISWEQSKDLYDWQVISDAFDTTYTFFPKENMYYRARAKQHDMMPEYSSITYIQIPPKANAGFDRIVPGNEVILYANSELNSTGIWNILAGNNGSLSDNENPNAVFQGTDSLYRLKWTLSNICGASNDTVEIRFRNNIYTDNIVIVDTTDTIISNWAQHYSGKYIIGFSQPVPVITDSTILIGLQDGGFLRKVLSYTVNDSVYTLNTEQASLADIGELAAFDLTQTLSIDTTLGPGRSAAGYTRLEQMPTRRQITTENRFKSGNFYYLPKQKPPYIRPGVTIKPKSRDGSPLIDLNFNSTLLFDSLGVQANITGSYRFTPNFIADCDYTYKSIDYFKLGLCNASSESNINLTLSATATSGIFDLPYNLFSVSQNVIFIIGGLPVVLESRLSIGGMFKADFFAALNFTHSFRKSEVFSAYTVYNKNIGWNHQFKTKSYEAKADNAFTLSGGLDQWFTIGPKLSFTIYKVVGPYISLGLIENLKFCMNNALDSKLTLDLNAELRIGAEASVLSYELFDFYNTWQSELYKYHFPDSLEIITGNNQSYVRGKSLQNQIKVKVHSSSGEPIGGARVRFQPMNGGLVSDSIVIANKFGFATTNWTPGGETMSVLKASVLNCEGIHINNSPVYFSAYADTSKCVKSDLAVHISSNGSTISPNPYGGSAPYFYSLGESSFSPSQPVVTPEPDQNYIFRIRDNDGCYASVSTTGRSCDDGYLDLEIQVIGDQITVTPLRGNAPYHFSVDDSVSFVTDSVFTNLSDGDHKVYVKDATSCLNSKEFSIGEPVFGYVVIGNQVWMSENMNIAVGNSRCYDDDPANCEIFGRMYDYQTAKTICPEGWHLPAASEWEELLDLVTTDSIFWLPCSYPDCNYMDKGSKALCSQNLWDGDCSLCTPHTVINNGFINHYWGCAQCESQTNNLSGFNGKPGGSYWDGFEEKGRLAGFWIYQGDWTTDIRNFALLLSEYLYFRPTIPNTYQYVRCIADTP